MIPRGERISGGPVQHARLTELKRLAGPSAPSLATPHAEFDLTPRILQRAERSRCTHLRYRTWLARLGGAVFLLKTRSEFSLGIKNKVPLEFVEGLNNKIRALQRRAYGYRDEEYFRLKILTCMLPRL